MLLYPVSFRNVADSIAYDTISIVDAAVLSTGNNGTLSYTVSSGAELLVIFGTGGRYHFSGTVGAVTVSWQSDTVQVLHETAISPDTETGGQVSTARSGFYYVVNPTPGAAQTLTFNVSNSTVRKFLALTLKGVDTTTPFSQLYNIQVDTNTGNDTNTLGNTYSPMSGAWVLDMFSQYTGGTAAGVAALDGQTTFTAGGSGDGGGNRHSYLISGYTVSSGSSVQSRYTGTNGFQRVAAYIGAVVNPKPL